jgi:hypothetical protein
MDATVRRAVLCAVAASRPEEALCSIAIAESTAQAGNRTHTMTGRIILIMGGMNTHVCDQQVGLWGLLHGLALF